MMFRKLNSRQEFDLVQYVREYMDDNENVNILIGCDSQNFREHTVYAVVVALYKEGKGAHVLYRRWKSDKERVRSIRLLNEVWYSVETAELLRESGLPKAKWIDIDLNPDPKYKSNEVFRQAVGLVQGMGYDVRYKSLGVSVTYAADHIVKS